MRDRQKKCKHAPKEEPIFKRLIVRREGIVKEVRELGCCLPRGRVWFEE